MTTTGRYAWWMAVAVGLGLVVAAGLALHARATNSAFGFPLDDPWIHLTYARTLREHGAFAYFAGGPPTAGSTAPLFTLLEALGFFVTTHEKPLAIGLGLLGQFAFLISFARWALRRLGDPRWAALTVALVGLDGRIGLLAVSGMETSLFLALTALAIERRLAGRAVAVGLALGAALWVRPDALILVAVFAIDALLGERGGDFGGDRGRVKAGAMPAKASSPSFGAPRWLGAFALVAAAYFLFNFAIGGRLLPATFAAKTAFYAGRSRLGFVTGDVAECFGSGAWLVLAPFALFAIAREMAATLRGRRPALRLETGWALALPLAYLAFLPYSHRFTRYLVPALPAFAILAVAGVRAAVESKWAAQRLRGSTRGGVLAAGLVGLAALHGTLLASSDELYRYACQYHAERHERAGHWLAEHTPPNAVIGAHDVGAIAFYSRRPIVDAVGLVSPEVTPWVGKPWYTDSLAALFDRRGVTYVAGFEEWLPIDDVEPLVTFNTEGEVMRVFPWIRGRTHLLSREVAARAGEVESYLAAGDPLRAAAAAHEALIRDPRSARLWTLFGDAQAAIGRTGEARQAWERAKALNPDAAQIARRLESAIADSARRQR